MACDRKAAKEAERVGMVLAVASPPVTRLGPKLAARWEYHAPPPLEQMICDIAEGLARCSSEVETLEQGVRDALQEWDISDLREYRILEQLLQEQAKQDTLEAFLRRRLNFMHRELLAVYKVRSRLNDLHHAVHQARRAATSGIPLARVRVGLAQRAERWCCELAMSRTNIQGRQRRQQRLTSLALALSFDEYEIVPWNPEDPNLARQDEEALALLEEAEATYETQVRPLLREDEETAYAWTLRHAQLEPAVLTEISLSRAIRELHKRGNAFHGESSWRGDGGFHLRRTRPGYPPPNLIRQIERRPSATDVPIFTDQDADRLTRNQTVYSREAVAPLARQGDQMWLATIEPHGPATTVPTYQVRLILEAYPQATPYLLTPPILSGTFLGYIVEWCEGDTVVARQGDTTHQEDSRAIRALATPFHTPVNRAM